MPWLQARQLWAARDTVLKSTKEQSFRYLEGTADRSASRTWRAQAAVLFAEGRRGFVLKTGRIYPLIVSMHVYWSFMLPMEAENKCPFPCFELSAQILN